MRIQVASDLHCHFDCLAERRDIVPAIHEADVLVLAGNVHCGSSAIRLYGEAPVPVIYVHGDHEPHGFELRDLRTEIATQAQASSVRYLDCSEVVINDVRFLGCCLWTDFSSGPYPAATAMREANRYLNCHRLIRHGAEKYRAEFALAEHQRSRAWLEAALARPFSGKTVVVSHYPPLRSSLPSELLSEALSAALASDLPSVVEQADVWIHGHVHDTLDYRLGRTRIVCNGRGYPWNAARKLSTERRKRFDPSFVIEV